MYINCVYSNLLTMFYFIRAATDNRKYYYVISCLRHASSYASCKEIIVIRSAGSCQWTESLVLVVFTKGRRLEN